MDKVLESNEGQSVASAVIESKCHLIDNLFQEHKLSHVEFDLPELGLFSNKDNPFLNVKYKSSVKDVLVHPMKICWSFQILEGAYIFTRKLQQELTKPLNIHLTMNKMTGYDYKTKYKENVMISRLLVDPRDVNTAINLLINEANRFYILYCQPT